MFSRGFLWNMCDSSLLYMFFLMHTFRKIVSILRFVYHDMSFLYSVLCFRIWFFHRTIRIVHTDIRMKKKIFSTLRARYRNTVLVTSIVLWCLHTMNSSFKILCLWNLILYTTMFVQNNNMICFILPHTVHTYQTLIWS